MSPNGMSSAAALLLVAYVTWQSPSILLRVQWSISPQSHPCQPQLDQIKTRRPTQQPSAKPTQRPNRLPTKWVDMSERWKFAVEIVVHCMLQNLVLLQSAYVWFASTRFVFSHMSALLLLRCWREGFAWIFRLIAPYLSTFYLWFAAESLARYSSNICLHCFSI